MHQFHEPGRPRPLVLVRERRPDQIVLHDDLQALGDARRKFAALLDAFERVDRYRSTPQRLGENIGGSYRVLHREIDADAADRRHGVRGVADADEARPVPAPQAVHFDGQ